LGSRIDVNLEERMNEINADNLAIKLADSKTEVAFLKTKLPAGTVT